MKYLDSPSGRMAVALFIFVVGVLLLFCHQQDLGKEIIVGALGSLYTAMRTEGTNNSDGNTTP